MAARLPCAKLLRRHALEHKRLRWAKLRLQICFYWNLLFNSNDRCAIRWSERVAQRQIAVLVRRFCVNATQRHFEICVVEVVARGNIRTQFVFARLASGGILDEGVPRLSVLLDLVPFRYKCSTGAELWKHYLKNQDSEEPAYTNYDDGTRRDETSLTHYWSRYDGRCEISGEQKLAQLEYGVRTKMQSKRRNSKDYRLASVTVKVTLDVLMYVLT
jgi:hypothetical protein